MDALLGAGVVATGWGVAAVQGAVRAGRPLVGLALHPPLIPADRHPARLADELAQRGREVREQVRAELEALVDRVLPVVVEEALRRLSITEIVRRHVDLDSLVAGVDVDAVVARADLDAAARRLDVESVVDRVDIMGIVDRVDIPAIVDRVDVDAVAARLDVDAVAARIDLDAIAARIDVDAVISRVDLVQLTRQVLAEIGLADIAEQVIDEIDLPQIIRDSTGSVTSEAVQGVRLQSVEADQALARLADRLLGRRRPGVTGSPVSPAVGSDSVSAVDGVPRQGKRQDKSVSR